MDADKITNEKLVKLENRIKEIYKEAAKDSQLSAKEYFEHYKTRWEKEYQAYKDGKYTETQWELWQKNQLMRGERYNAMQSAFSQRAHEANKIAAACVNDTTPTIYSINANYSAWQVNEAFNDVSFMVYNENTVRRLMEGENHVEFKTLGVTKADYKWNRDQITKVLVSEILQGKPIDKMASGFLRVMERNQVAALRNARTAVTSAQNAGRMDTFERANAQGINLKKEWIATHDTRTRDSHGFLDGVRVECTESFPNELKFPGDPNGAPAEVYNCRCTMRAILPEINSEKRKTYEEWERENTKIFEKSESNSTKNQNYKEVIYEPRFRSKMRAKEEIKVRKISNLDFNLYVEKGIVLKRRELWEIKSQAKKCAELLGVSMADLPDINILFQNRIGAIASYNIVSNQIYSSRILGQKKKLVNVQEECACANNKFSTLLHELIHWQDAKRYREGGKSLKTEADVNTYLQELRKNHLKELEKRNIKSYNDVKKISKYALKKFNAHEYDEVYTEYRVKEILRRNKR